jgi:hypothetical protein
MGHMRIRFSTSPHVPLKVTKWGGPFVETAKTIAPCHNKDPSLLKGPEHRQQAKILQPLIAMIVISK